MKNLSMNVFIGQVAFRSYGMWIRLPLSNEQLDLIMENFYKKYGKEYIIGSTEQDGYSKALYVNEYDDIYKLNKLINFINGLDEENVRLYLTIYSHFNQNEELANKFFENKRYEYFEDVIDEVTLGEKVIEQKLLGYISSKLISFIDVEKVGTEWICKGTIIYTPLKTAFREISESEYKEKVRKGLIK